MFKRILTLLWLMFLVFIFLPSVSTALTGGPDKGGYSYYDSDEKGAAPFADEWDDILNGRDFVTQITAFKDQGSILYGPVNIGFKFTFYGKTYDKVYVSKYGYLTFNDGPVTQTCYIQEIPTSGDSPKYNSADNFIAGMWAYLHPGA